MYVGMRSGRMDGSGKCQTLTGETGISSSGSGNSKVFKFRSSNLKKHSVKPRP